MEIIKYPDGTSYVELPAHSDPQPFTFRLNTYEDLWYLNQIIDVWNAWYKMGPPTITIPCLIDAQADRRFGLNQSSGLKLVLDFNKLFHLAAG